MIKRKLLGQLIDHLPRKEFTLIVGPRQAGKTTVMNSMRDTLARAGEKTVYLNLDIDSDRPHFRSQDALLAKIRLEAGSGKVYVFIDEIQRKEDAGVFLKGLFDREPPCKFIFSGSGGIELKEKIHESLAGRKKLFELNTLSFGEFADFRTDYRYAGKLPEFFGLEESGGRLLLEEYLKFGGYPRAVLEEKAADKKGVLEEIFRSCVEKDIASLLRIERVDAFVELVRMLAANTGRIMNYSDLAARLNLSIQTLKNYLYYGEKTFIFERLTPYFRNPRKELVKAPVPYFRDLGLLNYAAGRLGGEPRPDEGGFLFQNFVFNSLKESLLPGAAALHYWRSKEKAEVDFVAETGGGVVPFEVKYAALKKPATERSLRSFIGKYKPTKAFVVNLSLDQSVKLDGTEVIFLPFHRLLSDFL